MPGSRGTRQGAGLSGGSSRAYDHRVIATRPFYTLDDYERVEEGSRVRHEFVGGLVLAMAGGTVEHGRLAMRFAFELSAALSGTGCMVLGSDVRVGHSTREFRAYPDASVVCGSPEYAARPAHTVTNPRILVEVLSESTAAYDRGEKLEGYKAMPSVQAVVFVSQEGPMITVLRRAGVHFEPAEYGPGDTFELPGVPAALSVDAIYA